MPAIRKTLIIIPEYGVRYTFLIQKQSKSCKFASKRKPDSVKQPIRLEKERTDFIAMQIYYTINTKRAYHQ